MTVALPSLSDLVDLTKSSRRRVQAADLTERAEKAERALEETKRALDTAMEEMTEEQEGGAVRERVVRELKQNVTPTSHTPYS